MVGEDRETLARIISRLQEQVPAYRVAYRNDTIWIGAWEALREVGAALANFRSLNEDPVEVAIGLLLDALQERDPTASRPPVQRKISPYMVDASRGRK